jgi:hypothetical protein
MQKQILGGSVLVLIATLAACGGGGSATPPATNPPTSTPSGAATATPTPIASANASGSVVDYAADTALAGVQISIAGASPGASPTPVATTAANGTFTFATKPGPYLLYVGSNSPTDTRATLHQMVTLTSGANTLTGATPIPEANVTPVASQTAGALRLMALSSVQQDCLTGANTGRSGMSLSLLVPDEYLEEDAIADNAEEDAQATDTPTPLFGYSQPYGTVSGQTTSSGFDPCDLWTNGYSYTSGNPPYSSATSASNIWYGAIVDETNNPHYGVQMWAADPR